MDRCGSVWPLSSAPHTCVAAHRRDDCASNFRSQPDPARRVRRLQRKPIEFEAFGCATYDVAQPSLVVTPSFGSLTSGMSRACTRQCVRGARERQLSARQQSMQLSPARTKSAGQLCSCGSASGLAIPHATPRVERQLTKGHL
jgi:hypothetical protein